MSDDSDRHNAAVEGAFGFVLTTRDHAHGLSFWSDDYGFGPLFNATVFSEAEAALFDVPIADDTPDWLAMPAPLNVEPRS